MIEIKTYEFKKEFCTLLNIPKNQSERRQKELFIWLTNFYEFEYTKGHPSYIKIKEIYGDYKPLPRKCPSQEELSETKKQDYETFTIAALGTEFKPNSKAKVARDAIDSFGYNKYGHMSYEAVSKRYIKEPFDKYGETNNTSVWVWYSDYCPLSKDILDDWRQIMREEHISEQEAANAFYRQEQG